MPGVWGWPDLWWKTKCGCIGYGAVVIMRCRDTAEPGPDFSIGGEALNLDRCTFGAYILEPLTTGEKADVIGAMQRELALGRMAREMLNLLREIGKLTSKGEK